MPVTQLSHVLDAMRECPGDALVQTRACGAILEFVKGDCVPRLLVEVGAGSLVMDAMRTHKEDASLQFAACRALGAIVAFSEMAPELMAQGACECALAAMYRHPSARAEAMAVLANLASLHECCRIALMQKGVGACVLALMWDEVDDEHVVDAGMLVLKNLAISNVCATALKELGAVDVFKRIVHHHELAALMGRLEIA